MHSSRRHQLALRAVLGLLLPTGLIRGQSSVAPTVSGLVQTAGALAVEGADVFVLATLGATTSRAVTLIYGRSTQYRHSLTRKSPNALVVSGV